MSTTKQTTAKSLGGPSLFPELRQAIEFLRQRMTRLMMAFLFLMSASLLGFSSAAVLAQESDLEKGDAKKQAPGPLAFDKELGVYRFDPEHLQSSVSLIERIKNCPVTPVETPEHGPIFQIAGKVTLADGSPAVNATVILRESAQLRVSSNPALLDRSDRKRLAVPDVFARTQTDEEGRYEFKDVKSPTLPQDRYRGYWGWEVFAVSESQVGVLTLNSQRKATVQNAQAHLRLEKTQTIQATVVDEKQFALPNALVNLSSLEFPVQPRDNSSVQTWMSALTPMVKADPNGQVVFEHLPVRRVAAMQAQHPGFFSGSGLIVTSDEVPLGVKIHERWPDK
ncbi:MAG: carboxypeptidase-like regulatory domain-containing protein, partial [Planctomycetota bacterium]